MKKSMKVLKGIFSSICLAGIIVLCNPATCLISSAAETYEYDGFKYTLDGNNAVITKYVGDATTVDIPESLDGHTVVCIGQSAFENKSTVTAISVPNTVTKIDNYAFKGTGISELTLPSSLKTLGAQILSNNTGVTSITIPKSVEYTSLTGGEYGPLGESSVVTVNIEPGATAVTTGLCAKCTTLEKVNIPSSVTSIADRAFLGCTALSDIYIPDSVTKIEKQVFAASGLTSLKLPSNLSNIGSQLLKDNKKVKEIVVPKTIEYIGIASGYGPFADSAIKKVTFEEGTEKVLENICSKCTSLKIAEIPGTVYKIEKNAFYDCTSLHSITVPQSVNEIADAAFSGCKDLKVYCNYYSNSTPFWVKKGFSFDESDEPFIHDDDMPIVHSASGYYAERKAAGIKVTLNLEYTETDRCYKNKFVSVWIPDGFDVNFDTLTINGDKVTDYTYSGNVLQIPVNKLRTDISFYIDEGEFTEFVSYAAFTYNSKMEYCQTIGTINEIADLITLGTPDVVHEDYFDISGSTYPGAVVDIYVDDQLVDKVTVGADGNYFKRLYGYHPDSDRLFTIDVSVEGDERENASKTGRVLYSAYHDAELQSLEASYKVGDSLKTTELHDYDDGILPTVYYSSDNDLEFDVSYYDEDAREVKVTSTRNRETKFLSAQYNNSTHAFNATGEFEPTNNQYLPGRISTSYVMKLDPVMSANPNGEDNLANLFCDEDIEYVPYDIADKKITGQLGVDFDDNFHQPTFEVSLLNDSEAISRLNALRDVTKLIDIQEDNSKYNICCYYSFTDEKVYFYFYPCSNTNLFGESGSGLYGEMDFYVNTILQGKDQYGDFFEDYADFIDTKTEISSYILKKHGIYTDYHRLIREIENSDIANKDEAYMEAAELEKHKKAFSFFCGTLLPILENCENEAFPKSGYEFVYSSLLNLLGEDSKKLYDKGLTNVKGCDINVNWVAEPFGYINDAVSKKPIAGATVSAYYIPYDGTAAFFNKEPDSNNYGELWDAKEYEQLNPQITDETGAYAWDMPKGWYRIKCEKDEYHTYWSDWTAVNPLGITSNISLKPINIPPEVFEITYVLNGGVNAPENPSFYTEGEGVATLYAPKRDHYIFEGWYLEPSFATKITSIGKDVKKNLTLYAKWRADKDSVETITIGKAKYKVTVSSMGVVKQVEFVKTTEKSKSISIPSKITYKGKKVQVDSIAASAFKNNKTMTTVTIGKGIGVIGKSAFSGCTKLKTVKGAVSITEIRSSAFNGCKALSSMPTLNLLKSIDDKAFYDCRAITKFTIGSKVTKIGKSAFQNCKKLKSLTIKTTKLTTKNVGASAFKSISQTATIKVPSKMLASYKVLLKKKGITGKKQTIKK